jgi:hypothetical protein
MVKDGLNLVDIALIFIELHQYWKKKSGFWIYDLIFNSANLMDIALICINFHQ